MHNGKTIKDLEAAVDRAMGLETVKMYAMVDGFGTVIRMTGSTDSEASRLNEILRAFGSDRRWMLMEVDASECDA